jgi:hypothetical protein
MDSVSGLRVRIHGHTQGKDFDPGSKASVQGQDS